jgi:hypothetical protein
VATVDLGSVPKPPVSRLHLVHYYQRGAPSHVKAVAALQTLAADAAKSGVLNVLAVDCTASISNCRQQGLAKVPTLRVCTMSTHELHRPLTLAVGTLPLSDRHLHVTLCRRAAWLQARTLTGIPVSKAQGRSCLRSRHSDLGHC